MTSNNNPILIKSVLTVKGMYYSTKASLLVLSQLGKKFPQETWLVMCDDHLSSKRYDL